jgi:hypothetical protein
VTALFTTGPSIERLHEQYAKRRRIDDRAPVRAVHEVEIAAPIRRVWDLLSDPRGWPDIDPGIHDVHLDSDVLTDASFLWSNGRVRLRSRFAVLDPDREITWTGTAPGAKAVHRHLLEPIAGYGTRLRSEESMSGPLLAVLFPSRKLHAALVRWLDAVKATAEQRT